MKRIHVICTLVLIYSLFHVYNEIVMVAAVCVIVAGMLFSMQKERGEKAETWIVTLFAIGLALICTDALLRLCDLILAIGVVPRGAGGLNLFADSGVRILIVGF